MNAEQAERALADCNAANEMARVALAEGLEQAERWKVKCGDAEFRLARAERLLVMVAGLCPACKQPYIHDGDAPLANCRCGVTEWTGPEPLLSKAYRELDDLRAKMRHVPAGVMAYIKRKQQEEMDHGRGDEQGTAARVQGVPPPSAGREGEGTPYGGRTT